MENFLIPASLGFALQKIVVFLLPEWDNLYMKYLNILSVLESVSVTV